MLARLTLLITCSQAFRKIYSQTKSLQGRCEGSDVTPRIMLLWGAKRSAFTYLHSQWAAGASRRCRKLCVTLCRLRIAKRITNQFWFPGLGNNLTINLQPLPSKILALGALERAAQSSLHLWELPAAHKECKYVKAPLSHTPP